MSHEHGGGVNSPAGAHAHQSAGDGLSDSLHGFTLEEVRLVPAPSGAHLRFRVHGPSGAPQLQYSLDHGQLLHLYVVGEDLVDYQHVHPILDASGYWEVDLPRLRAGMQHVVASFVAVDNDGAEHALTLGSDVLVEGEARRRPLPPPVESVWVDGLDVRLDGELELTARSRLTLTVTQAGRPVDLAVLLQSWAHVTAVEEGSRALTHLHPAELAAPGDPSPQRVELEFTPQAPGRYRIFVDFATADGIHRAAFTRDVCC